MSEGASVSISNWLANASKILAGAGIKSARLDAELLLAFCLGKSREYLVAHNDERVPSDLASDLISRRKNREPLAYILGRKEFYGRDFLVDKNVLIPRPETENLVDTVVKITTNNTSKSLKILDVGTGSGCIAITLAHEIPHAHIFASDVDENALQLAKKNATNLGAKVTFLKSDLLASVDEKFDVIVANLPYVDRAWHVEKSSPETKSEPARALFADDNGLSLIKNLIMQAPQKLAKNGFLILELDPRQIDAIGDFARENGFAIFAGEKFAITLQKNC